MGRPKDRKQRELRRAEEELEKGIERHDGERAAAALLHLPPVARTPHLPAVATLYATEVERAHATHNQGKLGKLLDCAREEPRLLEVLPAPALLATSWVLLLSAAQRGDFATAASHLERLRPDLAQRAPVLLTWLSAWVEGEGVIADTKALPPLPSRDERLGYETVPLSRAPSPPDAAENVEPAVLKAAATLRPPDFRRLMHEWTRTLPATFARQVRVLAGQLSLREALLAAPERHYLAPLSLLATMAAETAAKPGREPALVPELTGEVLLGLRVLNACRGETMTAEEAHALSRLVLLAAQDPQHRALMTAYVSTLHLPLELGQRAAELYEKLLTLAPDPALWTSAVEHWLKSREAGPPPKWLQKSLEQLASRPSLDIAAWLRGLEIARQNAVFVYLTNHAPPRLGLELADRAWAGADPRLRHELGTLIVTLIESLPGTATQLPSRVHTVEDCLRLVECLEGEVPPELEELLRTLPPWLPIPEQLRGLLSQAIARDSLLRDHGAASDELFAEVERFADRLLPESHAFAELAMLVAPDDEEAFRRARRHLEHSPVIESAMSLLFAAYVDQRKQLESKLIEYTVDRWSSDAATLARALLQLQDEDAPRPIMRPFARALLLADAKFTGVRDLEYMSAIYLAYRLVPARERKALNIPELYPEKQPKKHPKKQAKKHPKKQPSSSAGAKKSRKAAPEPAAKRQPPRRAIQPAAGSRSGRMQLDLPEGFR